MQKTEHDRKPPEGEQRRKCGTKRVQPRQHSGARNKRNRGDHRKYGGGILPEQRRDRSAVSAVSLPEAHKKRTKQNKHAAGKNDLREKVYPAEKTYELRTR